MGGWVGGRDLAATRPDDLRAILDQHVWTTYHVLRAFVPRMAAAGWGRVIAVSSPVAFAPPAGMSAYAAAKAAEEALVLATAREAGGYGVTGNVLQVRTIDTSGRRDREKGPATASWTTPGEIAAAMLYLCSDEGGRVNGARVPLYGTS